MVEVKRKKTHQIFIKYFFPHLFRVLGYRVDSRGVEEDESFVKRMSGMIRLYAAIMQQKWPFSSKQGVNRACWLKVNSDFSHLSLSSNSTF